jgi:hypothetical protein
MKTHFPGLLWPLLSMLPFQWGLSQSSPMPMLTDYDLTSLPAIHWVGGDTTFCKGATVTIHGQDFKKATGGEAWDTTAIFLGGQRIMPISITSQGNGNDDRILLVLPAPFSGDTCLLLQVVKRTLLFPDTFLYSAKDTICLTGDRAQVTYADSIFCLGDTNPHPVLTLSPGTTGSFCCPSGAPSFAVFPQTGEIPLHPGAVGMANQFQYHTHHPRCGDTLTLNVAILPRMGSTATVNGQTQISICRDSPPLRPDSANLFPIGGMFRSWTGLMVLDSLTGEFAPRLSPAGQHGLWYIPDAPCYDSTEIGVNLIPTDTVAVGYPLIPHYSGTPTLCTDAAVALPVFTYGNSGGMFMASPSGLSLGVAGEINPTLSAPGTYTVYYATTGQCPDTVTAIAMLQVDTIIAAAFALPQTQYCPSDTLVATAVSAAGSWQLLQQNGQYICSAGNGVVPLQGAGIGAAGMYLLRHTTGGFCTDTFMLPFTVLPLDDPSFSYPPNGSYCMGDPDPWPLVTGMGGGIFSAVTAGTVVDPDGRLYLQASGAGGHVVRYVTNGDCPASFDAPVTIHATASANFAYAASLFCSADTNPLPQLLGTPGGSFMGDSGLAVVPGTGEILLAQSQPGTWNVTYALMGNCQAQFTQTVQVGATDSVTSLNYPQTAYCQADADPLPNVAGDSIGSFVAGAGIVFSNTDMGQLDLSAMLPGGPYTVYYDIENRCAVDVQTNIMMNPPDDPSFAYPQDEWCIGGPNPIPSAIAQPGGTFTEPTWNVQFIDPATGEIDARMSNEGGPYFITYTTAGPCPESAVQRLTLLPKPYTARLTVSPDSHYCTGQDVMLQATAGGAVAWRWWVNGMHHGEDGDMLLLSGGQGGGLTGVDTVGVAMENNKGCSDSLGMILSGLPAPRVTATVVGALTNALGAAKVEVSITTDNDGTLVDWVADGAGLNAISPAEGTMEEFGIGQVGRLELVATFLTPYDLGHLRILLSPRNASCAGFPDTVWATLSPHSDMIFVPEVFTPDGNGQNDTWMITCLPPAEPGDYRLQLFNAGGGMVYEMAGLHQGFDGGGLPDGVYWWVLTDMGGNSVQNGGLTIRRR